MLELFDETPDELPASGGGVVLLGDEVAAPLVPAVPVEFAPFTLLEFAPVAGVALVPVVPVAPALPETLPLWPVCVLLGEAVLWHIVFWSGAAPLGLVVVPIDDVPVLPVVEEVPVAVPVWL